MISIPTTFLAISMTLLVLALLAEPSSAFQAPIRNENTLASSSRSSSSSSKSSTSLNVFGFLNDAKKNLVKSLAGEYDAEAIQARTNGLINDNPVLMFSFTTCPFCIKAKGVLDDMNAKYTVVELDADPDGKAIRAEMGDLIGRTSVPAIWIGQEFVGGCNDGPMGGVVKLNEEGKLEGMLKEVGAL